MEKTLVMKFGGASLETPEQFDVIAGIIAEQRSLTSRVAVVVSAMGKTTDELIDLAKKVHPNPPQREYDMLLTTGERISMALLAMALMKRGIQAKSFTGSQSGIITTEDHANAKIIDVRPKRLLQSFEQGNLVIVAGFQGVSKNGEITTLGRGGSDTTAVALGIALEAEKVEFYKDVAGIYSEDPKKNSQAQLFSRMSYDEAIELTDPSKASRILHNRCLLLAKANDIPLHILSFKPMYRNFGGTVITGNPRRSAPQYECMDS